MTAAFNLSQFANKVNTSGQADLTTAVTGTLPVANGGTGITSAGTSGNVLQSNGTAWTSATVAFWIGMRSQIFTSSGTFTIPSGITAVKVTVIGGGGGGGSASAGSVQFSTSAGGGAGGVGISYLTGLTPGNTITVTVGGGGASTLAGGSSSVATGTQTITTITATGGGAGDSSGSQDYGKPGGAGGTSSGATINITGGTGGINVVADGVGFAQGWSPASCLGGSNILGIGGAARTSYGVGNAGTGYGGGGGGAYSYNGATYAGGAGSTGAVIFEW